jgi:NSS family neurotransmitter:Na+ symporter
MNQNSNQPREQWGSRMAFVLAAAGSAVGLGNIWKFPYITYENGGGKFVLLYLACILIVGLPVIVAEMMLGRATAKGPIKALEALGGKKSLWKAIGYMGVASGFIILSYYSVVAGWVMHYIWLAIKNTFCGMQPEQFSSLFDQVHTQPWINLMWTTIFMGVNIWIILRGVQAGIEKTTKILMPALFLILFALLINCFFLPNNGMGKAFAFLFDSSSQLRGSGVLEALGNAFFTLSLGMGAMLTYGSYLNKKENLLKAGIWVCVLDTIIALTGSIVIFSILFAYSSPVGKSAGLVFISLPQVFTKIPGGYFVAIAFFVLLFVAALTSSMSLLEVPVAAFVDSGWTRKKATWFTGICIWLLSIPCAICASSGWKNVMKDITFLDKFLGKDNFFDKLDYIASSWLLPVGGFFIALYTGWFLCKKIRKEQFCAGWTAKIDLYIPWLWIVRIVSPAIILLIILIEAGAIPKQKVIGVFDSILGHKTEQIKTHKK